MLDRGSIVEQDLRRVDCSHTLDEPGSASFPESLHELEPGCRFYDSITELVHQSVMSPTDKNQIVELRFTPSAQWTMW